LCGHFANSGQPDATLEFPTININKMAKARTCEPEGTAVPLNLGFELMKQILENFVKALIFS
jgi:hypothetical protein